MISRDILENQFHGNEKRCPLKNKDQQPNIRPTDCTLVYVKYGKTNVDIIGLANIKCSISFRLIVALDLTTAL